MPLNFYQGIDKALQKLDYTYANNGILFSKDALRMYGKFSDTFMPFGENRTLIEENNYNLLSEEKQKKVRQTYYIPDGEIGYIHPAYITANRHSLIILTNEEL